MMVYILNATPVTPTSPILGVPDIASTWTMFLTGLAGLMGFAKRFGKRSCAS